MRLRINSWFIVALMMMAMSAGCEPPQGITPVAPPGFEITRTPATPVETAQALGEQSTAVQANQQPTKPRTGGPNSPPTPIGQSTKTPSGLIYETLAEGTGPVAQAGQTVMMHYVGTLADGSEFDSSRKRNQPFEVKDIGFGRVIRGWNEGVPGMKVGERRKLTIPPDLAYGPQGSPPKIPANATLNFEVELLEVK